MSPSTTKSTLEPSTQQIEKIITSRSDKSELKQTGTKDPLFDAAIAALPEDESLPVSFLQRKFRLGYQRAVILHEAIKAVRAKP